MMFHDYRLNRALRFITFCLNLGWSTQQPETENLLAALDSSAFPNELYHGISARDGSLPCFPQRIHLSQASNIATVEEDENEVNMTVSFSLDNEECLRAIPTVIYGRGLVSEGRASSRAMHFFNYTSPVTRAVFESDLLFHVTLPSLRAGSQRYWYRIQVDSKDDAPTTKPLAITPTMTFQTPPLSQSPTTVALIGDLGQTEDSTVTMSHIYRAAFRLNTYPISLVVFAGDLSYADGVPHRWIRWLDLMEPLFRSVPMHAAAGNHEIECDRVTNMPFQFFENYFRNPNRVGPDDRTPASNKQALALLQQSEPSTILGHYQYDFGNSFYAVNHGLLHIITLSSYSDVRAESAQHKWLRQHLPSIDRSETPWVIVVFHAPLYTTFTGHVDETQPVTMKKTMEPFFVRHKVNLVVNGHDHGYMRTHPLAFGEVNDSGPIYLTVGAGGNREHHVPGYRNEEQEEWVAKRDRFEYGYGHLHVANATHAKLDWVQDDENQDTHDSVWILNPHSVKE